VASTVGKQGSNGTSGSAGTAGSSGISGSSGLSGTSGRSGTSGSSGSSGVSGTSGLTGSSGTSYAAGFVQTRAGFLFSGSTYTNIPPMDPDRFAYDVTFGAPMPSDNYSVTLGIQEESSPYAGGGLSSRIIIDKTANGFKFLAEDRIVGDIIVNWMAVEYNTGTGGIAYGTSGTSGSSGSSGEDGFSSITTQLTNVTKTEGNVFTKTSGGDSWNGGFNGQQGFPGAYVSATPSSTTALALIGISSGTLVTTDPAFIDYGLGVYSGSTNIVVIESGTVVYTHSAAPTETTRYSINYDTQNVRYYIDGVEVYVTARPLFGNLFMDASIYTQGAGFINVVFGPVGANGSSEFLSAFLMDSDRNIYSTSTPTRNLIPVIYSAGSTPTFTAARAYYFLTMLKEGMTINNFTLYNRIANASILYYVVIYEAVSVTVSGKQLLRPGNVLHTFDTSTFNNTATGAKSLTSLGITLAASSVTNTYFIGLGVTGANGSVTSATGTLVVQNPVAGTAPTPSPMAFAPTATFDGTFINNPFVNAPLLGTATNGAVPYFLVS
jgi:hypothetical protein